MRLRLLVILSTLASFVFCQNLSFGMLCDSAKVGVSSYEIGDMLTIQIPDSFRYKSSLSQKRLGIRDSYYLITCADSHELTCNFESNNGSDNLSIDVRANNQVHPRDVESIDIKNVAMQDYYGFGRHHALGKYTDLFVENTQFINIDGNPAICYQAFFENNQHQYKINSCKIYLTDYFIDVFLISSDVKNNLFESLISSLAINEVASISTEVSTSNDTIILPLTFSNGVYTLPASVNEQPLCFIFDTGAANVCISLDEATKQIKRGLIKDEDILTPNYAVLANGEIVEHSRVILRQINIGGIVIENVIANVIHENKAPLLLGQSAIRKLGTITLTNNQLIIIK